ncbi:hypothetical protein ACQX2E_07010 [Corynebacterium diphtheriae]
MMIKEILDALTGAFEEFGIFATDDWRDIDIPGAFVTVTNLSEFTLGSEFIARSEITFVVPDHGAPPTSSKLATLSNRALELCAPSAPQLSMWN